MAIFGDDCVNSFLFHSIFFPYFRLLTIMGFCVESKAFEFSSEAWRSSTKIVEKSIRVWRFVILGYSGIGWLVARVEAVFLAERQSEFIKRMRQGNIGFVAQQCSTIYGRFLTIIEHGGGGRWSVLVILKE